MCVVFFCLNPAPGDGDYHLILVNNRDEFYNRPTKPAAFWGHNNHCISGIDVKRGGAWLGASKTGRVGVLLDLLTEPRSLERKKPRGCLVKNYLTGDLNASQCIEQFTESGHEYVGFNILLFDLTLNSKAYYYSNGSEEGKPRLLLPGMYGLSNSSLNHPFSKMSLGRDQFARIVNRFGSQQQRDELLEKLWEFMSHQTSRSYAPSYFEKYCSPDKVHFGTRTTTILLVDSKGKCEYLEKTMREPIDCHKPIWDLRTHKFTMQTRNNAPQQTTNNTEQEARDRTTSYGRN